MKHSSNKITGKDSKDCNIVDDSVIDLSTLNFASVNYAYANENENEHDQGSDHNGHSNDSNSTNSNISCNNSKSRSSSCSNLYSLNSGGSRIAGTSIVGNSIGKLNPSRSSRVGVLNDSAGNLFETTVPLHVQRLVQARMSEEDLNVGSETRTTVMIRNLPNNYSQQMLLELLDGEGFLGMYDFVYLPMDFQTCACLGYAFINLVSPLLVPLFWETFDGYTKWAFHSDKIGFVSWCGPHQGLQAHIDRHRNSALMHFSVPDDYKPVIFCNGVRIPFPAPTKKLRIPRARTSRTATLPMPFAMQKPPGF
mmetsp:Transcript_26758/g.56702  ORF Transcript_26758/g.56702 Transcript_26758/m.56702 type:complete len:308 (-) Transcript_26758:95-1018(-)